MRSATTNTPSPSRRGGARLGAGRKATLVDAQPYKVTLAAETAARLRRLGNGNLSAGIRVAASEVVSGNPGQVSNSVPNAASQSVPSSTVNVTRGTSVVDGFGALDPKIVHVSPFHGRHDDLLRDASMRSLKNDVARGGNLIPVLVRQTAAYRGTDVIFEYELVYGRRRLQACLELGLPLQAVVRQMSMTDAFLAMMAEASSNWSAFELGVSLKRALDAGLFSSQRRLAEACRLEHRFVVTAIAIVALPPVVLQAFKSPTSISASALGALVIALERDAEDVIRRAKRLANAERLTSAKVLATLCGKVPA